MAVGQIG
jgi:hypothetical protein